MWSSDEEVDSDDETIHSLDKKKGLKQSQVSGRKPQLRDLESHDLCLGSEWKYSWESENNQPGAEDEEHQERTQRHQIRVQTNKCKNYFNNINIQWSYQHQDSADGIANELLTAGLIVGDDKVAMAANLDRYEPRIFFMTIILTWILSGW